MSQPALPATATATVPGGLCAAAATPGQIRLQLKRLAESPFFRGSKRCRVFLEHVVEHSLSDSPQPLKERTLGVLVFARDPAYDTSTDPVVRVTAGEVRRRLGQYYADEAHHLDLRIDLPPGSYGPIYTWPNPPPPLHSPEARGTDVAAPRGAVLAQRLWIVGAFAVGAALAFVAFLAAKQPAHTETVLQRFWAPILEASTPVLLCPGGLDMYELPADVKVAVNAAATSPADSPPIELLPRGVQRVGARYVAIGDAVAIARIAALFQEHRRTYQIREHNLTTFADLRASPTVLIGMFSNPWTLQLGSDFRFVGRIEGDGHHVGIIDRQRPDRAWRLPRPWPSLKVSRDYALVSRVVNPATGTSVITAAGLTPFGTAAAGEFLTSPAQLERALAGVANWSSRSLQLVLETDVIDGAASAPRVVATHVW
jgi:hypothetical protein